MKSGSYSIGVGVGTAAVNTRLEEFGRKHLMPQKMILHAESIFEELVTQLLLPRLGETPDVRFIIEYGEQSGEGKLAVGWNGEHFNPLAEADTLPLLLIRNATEELNYSYSEQDSYPNRLTARLR